MARGRKRARASRRTAPPDLRGRASADGVRGVPRAAVLSLSQVSWFLPAALLVGISPGANNLLAFNAATEVGWVRATQGLGGRVAAWVLLVLLVALGLDALFAASPALFDAVRWAGVAYLLFLGWSFWTAPVDRAGPSVATGVLVRREFLTLVGNPKAYLLLTAFLPQFVVRDGSITGQLLLLGALYLVAETLAAMVWIALGAGLGTCALEPGRRRLLNRVCGTAMVFAAVALVRAEG